MPPRPCDVRERKNTKFLTCKNGADLFYDGVKRTLHRQSPTFVKGGKACRTKNRDDVKNAKLGRLIENLNAPNLYLILRTKHMIYWLSVQGNTVIFTVLLSTEFCGCLCACYNVILPNLLKR